MGKAYPIVWSPKVLNLASQIEQHDGVSPREALAEALYRLSNKSSARRDEFERQKKADVGGCHA